MTTTASHVLSCNNMACRTRLSSGQIWVTYCSHIFCDPCGSSLPSSLACISCRTDLRGQFRLTKKTLEPGLEWKRMVLAGLPPETVMDICSSAIQFYQHQTCQEVTYLEERVGRVMARVESVRQYYEEVIEQFKRELRVVEAKLENTNSSSNMFSTGTSSDLTEFIQHTGVEARKLTTRSVGQMVAGDCEGGRGESEGGWSWGSKGENSWELKNSSGFGEEGGLNLDEGTNSSFVWGPGVGEQGGGGAGGAGSTLPYSLVRAEVTEQNKVKVNGQDMMFMERSSMVDSMNNISRTTTRSARSSYSQLPLLLGRLVGKTRSVPRLDQRAKGNISFKQLVPYSNRRF